jgi:hypothetical protein
LQTIQLGFGYVDFDQGEDSSPVTLMVPWLHTARGAHVVQVVAEPEFEQPTGNDQGDPFNLCRDTAFERSIKSPVWLLMPMAIITSRRETPSVYTDQLRLILDLRMWSMPRLIDDYDETHLDLPFNISNGGMIDNGQLRWTIGTIAQGSSGSVSYDVMIQPLTYNTDVYNTAFLIGEDPQGENLSAADVETISVVFTDWPMARHDPQTAGPHRHSGRTA